MSETTSPNVRSREIDNTGPTSNSPVGVPAAVISPTQKGPAFVPTTVPTFPDYTTVFGNPVEGAKFGALAAKEWLSTQQSFLQLRVLGAGQGTRRNQSGTNTGQVDGAGFLVGDQQPQVTLSGALGHNTFAKTSGIPSLFGSPGRTFFLAAAMTENSDYSSTFFSEAGLGSQAVITRGILFAASGVILTLSASNVDSGLTSDNVAQSGALFGFHSGSVNLSSGKQEFVMLLNGHKQTATYPRCLTASFDLNAANYFGNVFNRDPLKMEEAGYVLYSSFDIQPKQAYVTGSSFVNAVSGAAQLGNGLENIAFLLTSSVSRNSGSTTVPNFENFQDRFRAASTPWIKSQNFGGIQQNLFKIWMLDDGSASNTKAKFSIENIAPSTTDTYQFGTFDVVVRDFYDNDNAKVILEQWRGLNLDPNSSNYIGKIIGDNHTYFNFDTSEGKQRLVTTGEYSNNSNFIRVEISDLVKNEEMNPTALPVAFGGHQHLVTSGKAVFPALVDTNYLQGSNPTQKIIQPPVPFRKNLTKGGRSSVRADRNLYWGVQFETVVDPRTPNNSLIFNDSIESFNKYYPNFQTTWMNVVVRDNEGTASTPENGVLDASLFCNNAFSLEKVQVIYNSNTSLPDVTQLENWTYVRTGSIPTNTSDLTRALRVSDLTEPSVRNVAKFTLFAEGGFDGVRVFDEDCTTFSNAAVTQEMEYANRGLTNGPTVKSYTKALDILSDISETSIQLLAMPDIRVPYLTDLATNMVENRFDALFVMDIEQRDYINSKVTTDSQQISVKNTVSGFRNRGLNSSYAAAYFPDVILRDTVNRSLVQVPPSVAVLGAFGKNDALAHPWYAPAGFSRGALGTTDSVAVQLNQENLDSLYSVSINSLTTFPGRGPVVWGQKTLLAKSSAFDRINVRRLLIELRRRVRKVALRVLFQQNREATLQQFKDLVTPILREIKTQKGVDNFQVDIDTTTTTEADIQNKTIRGKIWVAPTKTLEFVSLDFVLNNNVGAQVG